MIDEALGDLTTIQAVDDISPEQKSEARFQRGMLYKNLDRLSEAREDFLRQRFALPTNCSPVYSRARLWNWAT